MPVFPFYDENPTERFPYVTIGIIVINLLALLYCQQLPELAERSFKARNGFVPARVRQFREQKIVRIPLVSPRERVVNVPQEALREDLDPIPREIITSMFTSLFLHAGWMHLISNMWFFWIFGNNIEDRLGHIPFLIFYLIGGLLASACHWLMATGPAAFVPVIGASGAVAVTLGAYAVTYPFARVRTLIFIVVFFTIVELPALAVLGAWFLMQMVSAAEVANVEMGGGVAWWAHIGGFAAGAILMPLLTVVSRPPIRQIAGAEDYPSDFGP